MAVDGDTNTCSCTTVNNIQPWWAGELLEPTRVVRVKVVNDPTAYWGEHWLHVVIKLGSNQSKVNKSI